MCGITGIVSCGRCGGPWGTQLGTDPWTEGPECRGQLRVESYRHAQLVDQSCPAATAKQPAAQTLQITSHQGPKPNAASPFLPCAIQT